jgi:hypothetical protein
LAAWVFQQAQENFAASVLFVRTWIILEIPMPLQQHLLVTTIMVHQPELMLINVIWPK